ncbi:hypothetical protein IAT38_000208 [Cryptococcus sp. DSM 104549]
MSSSPKTPSSPSLSPSHIPSSPPSSSRGHSTPTRSLSLHSDPSSQQRTPAAPVLSRPPSTSHDGTTFATSGDSRYPSVKDITTPSSPSSYRLPSTPRTPVRNHPLSPRSPSSIHTLQLAASTALPNSPSSAVYYSTPSSTFPSQLAGRSKPVEQLELVSLTPRHNPPDPSQHESPFHDRHSILPDQMSVVLPEVDEEDPFEYQDAAVGGGRQRTMPGYKFTSFPPRARDGEHGEPMSFGPMLDEIRLPTEKRRSLYPGDTPVIPQSTFDAHPDISVPFTPISPSSSSSSRRPLPGPEPIRPRFRGLFALTTARDYLLLFFPAVILSILSALIQPYMSIVIGDAFTIFAAYPMLTSLATEADRKALRDGVSDTSLKLTVAGVLALLFNYFKDVMWQRYGETVADRLREKVYAGVQGKSMEWFDMGMGMRIEEQEEEEKNESVGAGGLMNKFMRETDDVRMATSQAFGLAVQNAFTFLLCFILALVKSPILALVTLSTIPLVVLTQIATQVLCAPLYTTERRVLAEASTNVERVTAAISTVKVHNAQAAEESRFLGLVQRGKKTLIAQGSVWGVSAGLTDFFLLGTFVLGFWYGAKIVREGTSSSGAVMTCFWAALFSATYLQQVVPQLTTMTKGKNSMASLMTVIRDDPERPLSTSNPFSPNTSPTSATFPPNSTVAIRPKKGKRASRPRSLKGIRPPRCHGEFNLTHISFAYPSRPDNPVLRDISLFIPPGETTFIVGGSGSGKSTIAQLLLRLYNPTSGEITMDNQSFGFLDAGFTRENIAAVQQGCILFDMSVHDNVAMGLAGAGVDMKTGVRREPKDVTRAEVVEACKMAMIHDFVESLPDGYETILGTGGSSLSGGQRQRLAIARARIRNPTVLILDEATSALDATSRVLVFQALKAWRNNRTTIVITHDLSQIVSDDFVYVMQHGVIAEQGFRLDLVQKPTSIFAGMAAEQAVNPVPVKEAEVEQTAVGWEDGLEEILDMERDFEGVLVDGSRVSIVRPGSIVRPHTPAFCAGLGMQRNSAMYLDILDEYSRGQRLSPTPAGTDKRQSRSRTSLTPAQKRLSWTPEQAGAKVSSRQSVVLGSGGSRPVSRVSRNSVGMDYSPRMSLRAMMRAEGMETPRQGAAGVSQRSLEVPSVHGSPENGLLYPGYGEKDSPRAMALRQRQQKTLSENLENELKGSASALELSSGMASSEVEAVKPASTAVPGVFSLIRMYFPALPAKYLLLAGCIGSIGQGASTPVWSFFLAKLMTIVGTGGTDTANLTKYGLIVLGLCAAQGISNCVREYSLVGLSARWTHRVRSVAFNKLIKQDKAFFDQSANSPARLVQILIKDADDARTLMSHVIGKSVTVVTMIGLGLIWAMVVEWRLTLIGLALGPIFGGFMAVNSWLVGRTEVKCKGSREAVGRVFYESVANVRGIRAMAFDNAFKERFEVGAKSARKMGKNSGWVIAIGGCVAGGLPLFAQAVMNFAGSQFMLQGRMNYEQMLQVYNLVLFSLTFGSAMLDFIPTMAKARLAARDFNRIYHLPTTTAESQGSLRFPISGNVSFNHLQFAYPSRTDVPVLTDVSFTLTPGECVAIVGPSGSGKSTIAALLQRLYTPSGGQILLDKYNIQEADVVWLRNHIAVVSQSANLFDASIAENIAYGTPNLPLSEIHRAAKAANIHDFILSLPDGYETNLGENASLISGGQAQRLQIARALCRTSRILVLDECTSALDPDNAKAVLDTIVKIKDSRTTIFITHSVEAMQRCDRIICLGDGVVAEEGTFDDLVRKGGVFAQLMQTGEWE